MYIDNMGNTRDDSHHIICARCFKRTNTTRMSWFNTQMICVSCQKNEEKDPRYKQAKEAELRALQAGDRNYKGIGW